MSAETSTWLNNNIAVGFTAQRGDAWWLRAGDAKDGWESHFEGAVPEKVALDLLGRVKPIKVTPSYELPSGKRFDAPGKAFIVDEITGALYGTHSDGFAIHGYTDWLIKNTEQIAGQGLEIGQCGLLKGGAQAWVSFEMPDTIETKVKNLRGVEFRPQLLATTALDGSIATTYKPVYTIVVCDNTRSAALAEKGASYRVKHTKHSGVKIHDARTALEIVYTMADEFSAEVQKLLSTKVNTKQWDAFKEIYVPRPTEAGRGQTMADNKRDALNELYETDPMVQPWAGTAYGVIQAVNTWKHHKAIVRKVNRAERNMENALSGEIDNLDASATETLFKVLAGATA